MYVQQNAIMLQPGMPVAGFAEGWARGIRPCVVRVPLMFTPRGLGAPNNPSTGQQIGGAVAGGAGVGVSTAIATGSKVAGAIAGGLMATAPFTGPAAPFLMAAAAMVAPLASLFRGCGQTCVLATQYADEAGATVQQLADSYWAQPVRYRSMQQQVLDYFDQIAEWLRVNCGNPQLGSAGQRCISERVVRGGTAPWCPTPDKRGCDWYTTIRDPIAADAAVLADPAPVDTAASTVLSSVGLDPNMPVGPGGATLKDFLLPAALIGAALLI